MSLSQRLKNLVSKSVAVLIISTILFSFSLAFASYYEDVEDHWAEDRIDTWIEKDLASGYEDGTFRPDEEVTRAEFVAFVNRAFDISTKEESLDFEDVSEDDWYYDEIRKGVSKDILSGYPDGNFRPEDSIIRQEAASVMSRLLDVNSESEELSFDDTENIEDYAVEAVDKVYINDIMSGYPDNTFRPLTPITRAETVVTLDDALEVDLENPKNQKKNQKSMKYLLKWKTNLALPLET